MRILDFEFWILDFGFWILIFGLVFEAVNRLLAIDLNQRLTPVTGFTECSMDSTGSLGFTAVSDTMEQHGNSNSEGVGSTSSVESAIG